MFECLKKPSKCEIYPQKVVTTGNGVVVWLSPTTYMRLESPKTPKILVWDGTVHWTDAHNDEVGGRWGFIAGNIQSQTDLVTLLAGKQPIGDYAPAGNYAPATGISPSSIAGTAVITTDNRLVNARPPTSHASSHAIGGSDVITPSSIGAQPEGDYAPASGISPSAITGTAITSSNAILNHAGASTNSVVLGAGTTTTGDGSVAMGSGCSASGINTVSAGSLSIVAGDGSAAFGVSIEVTEAGSFAFGGNITNSTANSLEAGISDAEKIRVSAAGLNLITTAGAFLLNGVIPYVEDKAPHNANISLGDGTYLPSSVTFNRASGELQKGTLSGNTLIVIPSGGSEGKKLTLWITADDTERTLSLDAGIIIATGDTFTNPATIPATQLFILELIHNGSNWMLYSFKGGY